MSAIRRPLGYQMVFPDRRGIRDTCHVSWYRVPIRELRICTKEKSRAINLQLIEFVSRF